MARKEQWASRIGLVLAMAGNAVGLGNFLRFPAQAAKNGGGAFLIPYLVALVVMGLPLMWIEWTMGRYGGQFGHHSCPGVFDSMGRRPYWKYLGVFGLWCNLIIAAYYLYIESWTMGYAGYSLIGGFSSTAPKAYFAWLTGDTESSIIAISPWGMLMFAACIVINVFILSRGLAKGIEIVSKIGMPLLIVFAAILAIRGLLIVPGQGPHAVASSWADAHAIESPFVGLNFVWQPKFDSLSNPAVWLAAAGQIFFTLSIGMGSIHCYASYLRQEDDVALTGASAAWTNELCEIILGGTILIPIAVAYLGLEQVQDMTKGGSGFGLGFQVFPTLFQNWGAMAPAAGFLWFGLLFFAAITSSLAMGQPIMSFLQDEFGFTRERSALAFGVMLLPLAIPVAMLKQATFFDEFDYWGGTFALVVFATIETVLFSWVFGVDRGWAELQRGAEIRVPVLFRFFMKYVTPIFLLVILFAYILMPAPDWGGYLHALFTGQHPHWSWSGDGMIGKLLHADLTPGAEATDVQLQLNSRLKSVRTLDRLAMVAVFAFFALLVNRAWARRRAQGRTTP
ncbi:MAG TPA: sodium-dependent transporter [Planctomycetaceae bacterium]|nr:sodium-dependent transporter [Planctomycetaceae bacterium]